MISFFLNSTHQIFALGHHQDLSSATLEKLVWLFGGAKRADYSSIEGSFIGPRKEMVSPWSTNATEIIRNMGIENVYRVEEYVDEKMVKNFDPMLQQKYAVLDEDLFDIHHNPQPILLIDDIERYNEKEGLALSREEINYLESVSRELGRKLTDSEIFGFSQVNSEHCRHKIFNGDFVLNGDKQSKSLFQLIKLTAKTHHKRIVSAYKDNVAFIQGPEIEQFAPVAPDRVSHFAVHTTESVISLKAETHNFPTTVEPFYGASTGSGGEIRDRMAGGKAAVPLSGTAVYMTAYPRFGNRKWENGMAERKWLYQSPTEILIKASLGASDFGNKFGQPLTCGSVLTFEQLQNDQAYGFDKVIMLAGGIGYAKKSDAKKEIPKSGDKIVVLGGENYRIGMGGSAVSSVDTGAFGQSIELNAVQRANPEMQKRVANVIRAFSEVTSNPIISIHDHGAGGHLNCLSELVEDVGGTIYLDELPVGDKTLSAKEIIGNESQERMGLVIGPDDLLLLQRICERERAPYYIVGDVTGDNHLSFTNRDGSERAFDLELRHLFGSTPSTVLSDTHTVTLSSALSYDIHEIEEYLEEVLKLEGVACKDWLTNKVDRCVTGKVAMQQTTGQIQLPLNNCAITTIDYTGKNGIATSIGHAPVMALINVEAGSRMAIAKALTNLVWAPLIDGLDAVSLSANWMWPAKNKGENKRLYQAVSAVSDFAIDLGINIPTGKDSLSMKQKYPDGKEVLSPGTVIISTVAETIQITKAVSPDLETNFDSHLLYIPFNKGSFELGGSSFAQSLNELGENTPDIPDAAYFRKVFNTTQSLIKKGLIYAGHDIGAGGMITSLLEMAFPNPKVGLDITLDTLPGDLIEILFSERAGVIIQVHGREVEDLLNQAAIEYHHLGQLTEARVCAVAKGDTSVVLDIEKYCDLWFETSTRLDQEQVNDGFAQKRFKNFRNQPLNYTFPVDFKGSLSKINQRKYKAAILREKGVNSDREMAYALYLVESGTCLKP
jgi:phosphoribosylformylglycinamidine synthase